VILLTDRQTNEHGQKHLPPLLELMTDNVLSGTLNTTIAQYYKGNASQLPYFLSLGITHGLVAWYGQINNYYSCCNCLLFECSELECIDVTVPVQSMVKNSQLVVPVGTQLVCRLQMDCIFYCMSYHLICRDFPFYAVVHVNFALYLNFTAMFVSITMHLHFTVFK